MTAVSLATPLAAADSAGASASTLNISYTITGGANRVVCCAVVYANPASGTITGVTCGGNAMTKLDSSVAGLTIGAGRAVELWYIKAPASGAITVTITAAGASQPLMGEVIEFNNVDQTTSFGTVAKPASPSNAATTITVNTNSTANDIVLGVAAARATGMTFGGSQTSRYANVSATNVYSAGTTQAGATGATTSFTISGADYFGALAVPLLNDGISGVSVAGQFFAMF